MPLLVGNFFTVLTSVGSPSQKRSDSLGRHRELTTPGAAFTGLATCRSKNPPTCRKKTPCSTWSASVAAA